MKKRPELLTKCLSGLASAAIILTSMPVVPVHAEEETTVYVITDFVDFQKNEEKQFTNEETKQKYGNLTAVPGTPLDQLSLPEKLVLNGYMEADGPDVPTAYELTDFDWMLKSDIGEIYSEASPEGTYTFIPDFDAYALSSDSIDEFKLAEGVNMLTIPVTIAAETEAPVPETYFVEDAPVPEPDFVEDTPAPETDFVEDAPVPETYFVEDTPAPETYFVEDTPVPETDFVEDTPVPETDFVEDAPVPETDFVEDTPVPETEFGDEGLVNYYEDTPSDSEDIFAGLDDSAFVPEQGGDVMMYDENGNPLPEDNEPASPEEGSVVDPGFSVAALTLRITDSLNHTYDYIDVNGSNIITLTQSETAIAMPVITLPCAFDLTQLSLQFANADPAAGVTYTLSPEAPFDFATNSEQQLTLTETVSSTGITNTYPLLFNITKSGHSFAEADCTTPKTCTVCGMTEGEAAGHQWIDATCTSPKTCQICGAIEGEALGHQWTDAACTVPRTCKICGVTEGAATGHQWIDATCTSPKTCKICGATEGAPVEHQWIDATCTSPKTCKVCGATEGAATGHRWVDATCTTPKTCQTCGAIEGEALGHDWIDAACTTPKTCKRCKTIEGEALGHDWIDATCTEPKTCNRCGATKGKALGHDLTNDWEVMENSTYSTHGKEVRYCYRIDCDYMETRPLNIIGNPANNMILNLSEGGQYNLNTKITFSASGAAMENAKPINGDVRYIPYSWNIQNTPGNFMDGFTGAFSITKAGSYTVGVNFQKQIYQDGSWKGTDVYDSRSVTFNVGNLVQGTLVTGTPDGIKINPQTGDSTPIIPLVASCVIAVLAIVGVVIFKKRR